MLLEMLMQEARDMSDEALIEVIHFVQFRQAQADNLSLVTADSLVAKYEVHLIAYPKAK